MKIVRTNRSERRKKRVSSNIVGTKERPRISVFRSNRYTYAQAIDDTMKKTVATIKSLGKGKKTVESKEVGVKLAKILKEKKIDTAVFDRGRYPYAGRVAKVAEGLREGGIKI